MSRIHAFAPLCALLLTHVMPLEAQGRLNAPLAVADGQSGIVSIEVEALLNSAIATHGRFGYQDMRPFGNGWSQDGQLFWGVAQLGAQLRLTFKTAVTGRYQAYLRFTKAPDFSLFRASFDGAPSIGINGYAPNVTHSRAILGMFDLTPGVRELLVEVAMKDGKSSGLNVGLDRIELEPFATGGAQPSDARLMNILADQAREQAKRAKGSSGASTLGGGGQTVGNAGPAIAAAQLAFAEYNANSSKPTLGSMERNVFRPNLLVSLAWTGGGSVPYRWQVLSKPPARGTPPSLTPAGLLAEGSAAPGSFKIALDSFQPLAPGGPAMRDAAQDFYIRIVPVVNNALAGPPSNMVVAHFLLGGNPADKVAGDAMANQKEMEKKLAEMAEQAKVFEIQVVKFQPMVFEDPNRYGCIVVISNQHYGSSTSAYSNYKPGQEYCPASYRGAGYHAKNVWDVVSGWVKAYDIVATFYSDAKDLIAKTAAQLAPCEAMGSSLSTTCEQFVHDVTAVGISAGLIYAGVPPALPNVSGLSEIAEGKVAEAAADYTCAQFATHGGECTPAMRAKLIAAYKAGIDQIQQGLVIAKKEPHCGNVEAAHNMGKEPFPCFTQAGLDVKPATGAVSEAARVTVAVRRIRPNPAFPLPACVLHADLSLTNYFAGGDLHGVKYPASMLSGLPFMPVKAPIPNLGFGQTTTLTLVFDHLKPFLVPGNPGSSVWWDDWLHLYKGGKGPLKASASTVTAVPGTKNPITGQAVVLPCANLAQTQVQIPG